MLINTTTFEYPVTESQLRALFPGTCFPGNGIPDADLVQFGFANVIQTTRPEATEIQHVKEIAPEPVNGAWHQAWEVVDFTASEIAQALQREKDAACARLNAKRDAIQYGTFTDSHGHPYDVDSKGREKMTGLEAKIANGLTLPPGFSWTGADNEEYQHDTASFLAMTTEILIWTSTVHGVCVAGKGAVRAAETVEAVKAAEAAGVWP